MKDPLNRTKVVIRHLPPSLSQSSFFDQIDLRFAGRYNWSSFRPSKNSHKRQTYARAYINFNSPEDVFQFAEFFNGHVFVNEKGAQFKVIVEYSPSQRVPDASTKKDGREGTIFKDPEYVEFLEHVSKPMENLPSADVQLERREAERAGIPESPVVTPLMEYVRKKRAGKSAARDIAADVKFSGRVRTALRSKSRSSAAKQISEKKKYILKASGKSNVKDESTYILLPRRDDQLDSPSGKGLVENESESVSADTGKKKILLLKGKEPEISQNKVAASPVEKSPVTSALKMNPRHDAGGRINRSISLNKETFQSQSSPVQLEQKLQTISSEKSKRPPRAAGMRLGVSGYASINECSPVASESVGKRSVDDKSGGNGQPGLIIIRDKQEKRTRNKDRLDRGVWTPLRHSDRSYAGGEQISQQPDILQNSHEVNGGHPKIDVHQANCVGEVAASAGSHNRHFTREGKSSKRGGAAGHSLHEKQIWIQKSASGS